MRSKYCRDVGVRAASRSGAALYYDKTTYTTDKLQTDISNITKSYDTIMLSHAQLQTQINYFASLVTGQNEVDH